MSRSTRALWTAVLLLPLIACDRNASPGLDTINDDSFAEAPRANRTDTDRDSISGGDEAYEPVGTTSGARSTAEAVSSQPGGDPNTSKYTETGTTDGTSTTSGRSLTRENTTAGAQAITSGDGTTAGSGKAQGPGQTTSGRGTLNNVPRETTTNNAQRGTMNGPGQGTQNNQNNNQNQTD
ncbi:hypothetical protein [Hymenobacter koreensis]|uniref:Uncharacterized protein n=1 Tax=Hymenobacter koreensis TaxID=1084523 RepID=A0ABP8IUT0_9BACT